MIVAGEQDPPAALLEEGVVGGSGIEQLFHIKGCRMQPARSRSRRTGGRVFRCRGSTSVPCCPFLLTRVPLSVLGTRVVRTLQRCGICPLGLIRA